MFSTRVNTPTGSRNYLRVTKRTTVIYKEELAIRKQFFLFQLFLKYRAKDHNVIRIKKEWRSFLRYGDSKGYLSSFSPMLSCACLKCHSACFYEVLYASCKCKTCFTYTYPRQWFSPFRSCQSERILFSNPRTVRIYPNVTNCNRFHISRTMNHSAYPEQFAWSRTPSHSSITERSHPSEQSNHRLKFSEGDDW